MIQPNVLIQHQETQVLVFFISCFTVSVTSSIYTLKSSIDFMILITSFMSSFEINKANSFPDVTTPFPLIFLSDSFIAFEAILLINLFKVSLAKGI